MRKTIALKIDLTKIDKQRIYVSEKTGAKYLDAVLMYDSEPDQYDQNGMIVQSVSKEEREAGTRGAILGNAKELGGSNEKKDKPLTDSNIGDDEYPEDFDSLPF